MASPFLKKNFSGGGVAKEGEGLEGVHFACPTPSAWLEIKRNFNIKFRQR